MSLWTNVDEAAGKPKSLNTADKAATYGVDVAEAQLKPVAHAGWVKVTEGSGGRAGRTQYETLVAMGSMATDAEDVVFADPTIIIGALTTPVNLTAPAALEIAATVTGTATSVSYQWQVSADGSTGWADVADATTATLTVDPTVAGTLYYKLVASVKASKTTAALSAESNVVQVVAA